MENLTGIVIQARTRSTRLPGKILIPFYNNESVLDIILKKLGSVFDKVPVIVATSTCKEDDLIENVVSKYSGVKLFRGEEENVLKRFIDTADYYNLSSLIRVCSDNVFTDTKFLSEIMSFAETEKWDYVSFKLNGDIPAIKTHQGFYTEWVTLKTLKKVSMLTSEKIFLEHVTNFVYSHPEIFKVHFEQAPEELYNFFDLRLTIDTKEDFKNSQYVYSSIMGLHQTVNYINVIKIVKSNEQLLDSMREQIKFNLK
jgi:spore coat polysaccharide biosynthesis protein SpsF